MEPIKFTTPLLDNAWDAGLAAWRCSAVCIPGATVSLVVNGFAQDPDLVKIDNSLGLIKWLGASDQRPTMGTDSGRVVAIVELTRKLTPRLNAVNAVIIAALIGLAGTVFATIGGAVVALLKPDGRLTHLAIATGLVSDHNRTWQAIIQATKKTPELVINKEPDLIQQQTKPKGS